jgi:L-ascorbate metabolism protein UlaG (beta-lactamase superfamily)
MSAPATPSLTFLNHASFLIDTGRVNLVIDPWLEGTAFYDGWSLLDDSTSNSQVYAALTNGKRTIIWYSHEHSDHFSISFLRHYPSLLTPSTIILYQYTLDKRVFSFLRSHGFNVEEQITGRPFLIGDGAAITTFTYKGHDRGGCRTSSSFNS